MRKTQEIEPGSLQPIRYLQGSDIFLFSFLSTIFIFLSLGSAVHWTLSPQYHE